MKNLSVFFALVLSVSLFLTACDNSPPSSTAPPDSAPPTSGSEMPSDTRPYDDARNPYNIQTATTDEYIFVVQEGSIHRVERGDGTVTQIIKNEDGGPRIAGAPSIAVFDDHIYFMCTNNALDVKEGRAETLDMGVYRADLDGGNIAQVASTESGVYQLFLYDGYLVVYTFDVLEELSPDDSFRFFRPDSVADTLEEVPLMDLGADRLAEISRFVTPEREPQLLWERLRLMGDTPYYSAVRANDGYYYIDATGSVPSLYRVPFAEHEEPMQIELSAEATKGFRNMKP